MKILFDTCTVVNIFGKTESFSESFIAYDIALYKKMDVCLSVSSTTDIVYLLHSRGFASKSEARFAAMKLGDLFDILDNTASDFRMAAESNMPDYEDALIAYSAHRQNVDLIITQNKKDFASSPVPALTPAEFIAIYKPTCLNYETVVI